MEDMQPDVPHAEVKQDAAPFAEGKRLHPLTFVQRIIKSLPALFVALLPLLARSSDTSSIVTLGFVAIYGVVAVPLILLQYLRFHYWITPKEVVIHSGVLTRRKRNIPLDRIQNIVIERSLLPRLLGTAKVKIETAGSTSTEGVLEYVSFDEAQDIRQIVRTFQRTQSLAAPGTAEGTAIQAEETAPALAPTESDERMLLFEMSLSDIVLSGAFRFSLLYIALIFSGLQYAMDLTGLTPEDIVDWFMRGNFRPYAETAQASPWLLGIGTVFVAALLGWLTGIVVNLNKYYGFRLWLDDNKLQRRQGLLTVSEGTIPIPKVQSLILRSNPLMRRFGWFRLKLQTMGYDVEHQGYQDAAPFAREADVLRIGGYIRPFSLPETFTPVSRLTIRRAFVRYTILLLLFVLPLAYFWRPALWGLVALPGLLYFAVLHWRNHGYALQEDLLFIRRGVIRQYLWVVPLDKFQVFYTEGTLFQRRLGLRSLTIDTAGAGSFSYPRIVDVPAPIAAAFMQTLYDGFQAKMSAGKQEARSLRD